MKIFSIVAIAAWVVSGALTAAEVAPAKEGDQAAQVGMLVQTCGKVVKTHSVQLVDIESPHVLAKIQTEQGDTDIVDLGTAEDLKANGIDPCEGKQLWVSGRIGRINDKELVVAENLSESKFVTIARTPLLKESEKHAAARGAGKDAAPVAGKDATPGADGKASTVDTGMTARIIDGKVISTQKLKFDGEPEEHTLAKLQTELGIVVVDLGEASAIPKVDLNEGQLIAVTGFVGHLNEKPIIVADMVGNLSTIKRQLDAKVVPAVNENPVEQK